MESLLFLAQRMPYPPTKGDKIRSFEVLRHFSQTHRIHLGCFIDDPADWAHVEAVRAYCADLCCVEINRRWRTLGCLAGLARGTSLSEAYFRSRRLSAWVGRVLADVRPSAAFLYSSVTAQLLPLEGPRRPARVVMDFVDVDSLKWGQYAEARPWPLSWVFRRECRRLLAFDRRVAQACDAALFVSKAEAALFRDLAPETADRVHPISNGVNHHFFDPATPLPPADLPAGIRPLVMTGAMDYWPNVDAARWFVEQVLPRIRARSSDVRFVIVGGNPTADVLALGQRPDVIVTGRVADVRPYLAAAAVVVAPLRVARGIQNKVLEGMAMGRLVVTTPQGFEGIEAEPGREVLVAEGDEAFASAVSRGLDDSRLAGTIGERARARVVADYDWRDKLAAYRRVLGGTP